MASVIQRSREISQPRGGYISLSKFKKECLEDNEVLSNITNVDNRLVGLAVDYLSRMILGSPKEEAFSVSLKGARIVGEYDKAMELLDEIKGLDDESISHAVNLVRYDSYYRNNNMMFEINSIKADLDTINNIRIMVKRVCSYLAKYEDIKTGVTFEGAYTNLVHSGEADVVTNDAIYDIKVLSKNFDKNHIMQLLIYYQLLLHSYESDKYQNIKYLCFINPKYNRVYKLNVNDVSTNIWDIVKKEIIGYKEGSNEHYKDGLLNQYDLLQILDLSSFELDELEEDYGLNLFVVGRRRYIFKSDFYKWLEAYQNNEKYYVNEEIYLDSDLEKSLMGKKTLVNKEGLASEVKEDYEVNKETKEIVVEPTKVTTSTIKDKVNDICNIVMEIIMVIIAAYLFVDIFLKW